MASADYLIFPSCAQDFLEEEELLGDAKDKQAQPKQEEEAGDPNSLLGSHRALYGADCELLVDQFQLHSQVYKKHQMALLEVSLVYRYYGIQAFTPPFPFSSPPPSSLLSSPFPHSRPCTPLRHRIPST